MFSTFSLPTKVQYKKAAKKSMFTEMEDTKLKEIVLKNGACHWGKIAMNLPGRSARQCRDRWFNYLDPLLSDKEWTKEEDNTLINMHKKYGNRWKDISNFLEGRSLNSIRNRVLKLERKKKSKFNKNKKTSSLEETEAKSNELTDEHKSSDDIFDFKDFDYDFINDNEIFGCLEDWDSSNPLNK